MNPSEQITNYIAGITDWRGQRLAGLRKLVLEADSGLTEEWKWSVPVWSHKGMVCGISAFKELGLTFSKELPWMIRTASSMPAWMLRRRDRSNSVRATASMSPLSETSFAQLSPTIAPAANVSYSPSKQKM